MTPTLQFAASRFLAYFLQPLRRQSGGGPLSPDELSRFVAQLGPELEITLGEFRPWTGAVPSCGGTTVPATHAVFVQSGLVGVASGGADEITLTHTVEPVSRVANKYVLRWLVERADIRVDSRDTLARVLGDWRTVGGVIAPSPGTPPAGSGAGDDPFGQPPAHVLALADAIASIPDRGSYPMTIDDVQSAPAGVDLTPPLFRELLRDFFTFDEEGVYYAKWWGAEEGAFPLETTEMYRRLNVQTGAVTGDNVFVLANVPASFGLPDHADRQAGEYREFIAEIVPDAPSGELSFRVINSAVKAIAIDGAPPRNHFDFCFFSASRN